MRRSSALLVSLLLVAAGIAAPLGVSAQESDEPTSRIVSMNGTANYLAIPDDDVARSGTATNGIALGTAIAGDTSSIHSDLVRLTFEQSFEQATTDAEKTAAIRTAADRLEARKAALVRQDSRLVRSYESGSVSAEEFTRERARIHTTAQRYQETAEQVSRIARADNSYSFSTALEARLANVGGELEVLQGPVSGQVASAANGDVDSEQLYVEASTSGYTMAYVTDGLYVRETYLGDQYDSNATDQFMQQDVPRQTAADLRGYELYPWMTNNSLSPSTTGLGTSGIYRFTTGELTAYISGSTTNVFRESQRHKLDTVPFTGSQTSVNETLRITVNRTYETGPMEISVSRDDAGVSANSTVLVNGETVGHTGTDGTIWTVEPRGPVTVRADAASGGNVTASVPA